jgi:hypothetical protein
MLNTTKRLEKANRARDALSNNDYVILYDTKEQSNNVLLQKMEDKLVLRFQEYVPFDEDEFEYFKFTTHNRVHVPWEYFDLIFHTIWLKFGYTYKREWLYQYQPKFSMLYIVKIIYENESFLNLKNNDSQILMVYEPQGNHSRIKVYFDRIIDQVEGIKDVSRANQNTILQIKPSRDNIQMLASLLIKGLGYKF